MRQTIPWSRILAEGAIIVASILLAFALDAWWDSQDRRGETVGVLMALEDEFAALTLEIDQRMAGNDLRVADLERLLAVSRDPSGLDVAEVDQLFISVAVSHSTWDPVNGALKAVLGSGGLTMIESAELRSALAAWESTVEEVRDGELLIRDLVRESIIPTMGAHGVGMSRTLSLMDEWPTPRQSASVASSRYQSLLSDSSFTTLLEYRHMWQWHTGTEYAAARATASRISELIADEVARLAG